MSPEAVRAAASITAPVKDKSASAVEPPTLPEKVVFAVPESTVKFLPDELPSTVLVNDIASLLASKQEYKEV